MYKFIVSSSNKNNWLNTNSKEVCFIGRSNVGKSSLINAVTKRNGLAKTSNTPGRTQLINFFQDDNKRTIVDLPGYGFAKMPKNLQEKMIFMLEEYFSQRKIIKMVFLLIDSKVGMTEDDLLMYQTLKELNLPNFIILTKSDKAKQSEAHKTINKIKSFETDFLSVSSYRGSNIAKLRKMIENLF